MEERVHLSEYKITHYLSTFLIVVGCYIGAVAAPGVAFVWSLLGSFMAYLVAFILPTVFYLQIENKLINNNNVDNKERRGTRVFTVVAAWILLIASICSAIACTTQTTYVLFGPK